MEEIDLSEELQEFYEKHKHEKYIRNWEETLKKIVLSNPLQKQIK